MEYEPEKESVVLSRRDLTLLVASLMMAIALAALDSLIVGTAMPTIVGSLGGLSLYSWLVSAYLLTSTATVPIYGRLADMWGRKPIMLFGIGLFILGSALCGLSTSMLQLIVFRGVQGLGAGAVQPMAMTIIGDVFSVEQRARMQGLFSGVWGVSSVIGPPLGALIVTYFSWHWIFYVNVPIGLVTLVLIGLVYHERVEHHRRSVDFTGAALLLGGTTALLFVLQETGQPGGLAGAPLELLYLVAFLLLGLFVWTQARSPDPTVPLALFRRPIIGLGYLAGFLVGLTQFGVGTYLPLFVQGALGGAASNVGAVMAPMSIGWPVGSIVSGRLILKSGYKGVLVAGLVAVAAGAGCLVVVGPATPQALLMGISALVGLGMGLSSTPTIIAIQNAVAWNQRGVATALNQFTRTMGGVVGVALMGSLLNVGMAAGLAATPAGGTADPGSLVNTLLDPVGRAALAPELVTALQGVLAGALQPVFIVAGLAAVVALGVTVAFFPSGSVRDHASAPAARTTAAPPHDA
ncbi:MAG: MDR family MFS transporter [Chloroflexota bacterium]